MSQILSEYWFIVLGSMLLMCALGALKLYLGSVDSEYSYRKVGRLLTRNESKLFDVLSSITEGEYLVFSKVRVADVITPSYHKSNKAWIAAFNKVRSKHFDFVIRDKNSSEPKVIIELDDRSHNSNSARKRDGVKNNACESAGIPLLRVRNASDIKHQDLALQIAKALSPEER